MQTLARGGHVLVPTLPAGLLFLLFENVVQAKEEFNGHLASCFDVNRLEDVPQSSSLEEEKRSLAGGGGVSLMGQVAKCPLLFISSQSKASLTYANASGEWLAPDRETALYAAESPFPHNQVTRPSLQPYSIAEL